MSQTVPLDEAMRDRRAENRLNEVVRHCRIGKVKRKLVSGYGHIEIPDDLPPFKWPQNVYSAPLSPRKCSCKPGTACGNVACPYLPIATC